MAPTRPQRPTRAPGRRPPRKISIHASRITTLRNTERFWIDYLQHPRPAHTRDDAFLALPRYSRAPAQLIKTSLCIRIGRWWRKKGNILYGGVQKAREALHHGVRRARDRIPNQIVVGLLGVGVVVAVFVSTNAVAYAAQPIPPPLAKFRSEPTFLYAHSPDQMLGLHEPLFPSALQPLPQVKRAYRRMNLKWHPDKTAHRVRESRTLDRTTLSTIHRRLVKAFNDYYKRPPEMSIDPGDHLPWFQPGCVCNVSLAVSNLLEASVTPFWKQAPPPQTDESLKDYCPCSITRGIRRLWLGYTSLPPPISKYYGDEVLAKKKDPGSLVLMVWGNGCFGCYQDWVGVPRKRVDRWLEEGWITRKEMDGPSAGGDYFEEDMADEDVDIADMLKDPAAFFMY